MPVVLRPHLERADAALADCRFEDATAALDDADRELEGVDPADPIWSSVLARRAVLAAYVWTPDEAVAFFRDYVDRATRWPSRRRARTDLALALLNTGRVDEAGDLARSTLADARAAHSMADEAEAMRVAAVIARRQGASRRALSGCEQALKLARRAHDEHVIARTLSTLGLILLRAGRAQEARDTLTEAIDLHRAAGRGVWVVLDLADLVRIHLQRGDLDEAERGIAAMEALSDAGGTSRLRNYARSLRGEHALLTGDMVTARALLGSVGGKHASVWNEAVLAYLEGDHERAETVLRDAGHVDGPAPARMRVYRDALLAACAARRDDFETARHHFARLQAGPIEIHPLTILEDAARCAQQAGQGTTAARWWARVLSVYRSFDHTAGVARAEAALQALRGVAIPLGRFLLDHRVGSGGDGVVWSGRHEESELPVAIKLLRPDGLNAGTPISATSRSEMRELRATVALHHPNIVPLLDVGRVPDGLDVLGLTPGTPFLVQPLYEAGDLSSWCGRLPYRAVRHVLIGVLRALGHAHARHLVHLDVKAENVLIAGFEDGLPQVALGDFGLAYTYAEGTRERSGTPSSMAPEQIQSAAADVGPWTDLYAVGVLAWRLVTGHSPYRGTTQQILQSHLTAPRPSLPADAAVPAGLDAWIRLLLSVVPGERPTRAAAALYTLPDDDGTDEPTSETMDPEEVGATFVFDDVPAVLVDLEAQPDAPPTAWPSTMRLPSSWTEFDSPGPLPDAGMQLASWREVPMVGRLQEREALWEALRDVTAGGSRHVAMDGGPGLGRTRLGRWLCHQVHEVGIGLYWDLPLARHGSLEDAIASMLRRLLVTRVPDRSKVFRQLSAILREDVPEESHPPTEAIDALTHAIVSDDCPDPIALVDGFAHAVHPNFQSLHQRNTNLNQKSIQFHSLHV